MDKDTLIRQLMSTFLEELEEHVRSFNQDLLTLEKNPTAEEQAARLKTLFRAAHSLKGAARSVNVTLIEGACHRLEEVLAAARDGRLSLDRERIALLFATVDGIQEAGMRLREQQDLTDAPLAALLPSLELAASRGEPRPTPMARCPDLAAVKALGRQPVPAQGPVVSDERGESARVVASAGTSTPACLARSPVQANGEAEEGIAQSTSVRVAAEKLDTLLARTGELLVARRRTQSRLGELLTVQEFVEQWKDEWQRVESVLDKMLPEGSRGGTQVLPRAKQATLVLRKTGNNLRRLNKELEQLATVTAADGRLLEHVAGPLDQEIRRVRMLPFSEACAGLDRLVRDLAQSGGKEVDLMIEGGAVELDRSILEGLKDPLRHLVRNAIDHGVELPSERQQARKARVGRIVVGAALRGSQVEVTVADDGRGLDLEALRGQARRRQWAEPADERDLVRLIFQPGFSTASIITDVSGRGVGLDVVKSRVESLHGTVDLSFVPGAGTRFTLTVPLTLTTLRAVLIAAGGRTYALAGTNVQKFVRASVGDLRPVAGRPMLALGGAPLPFAYLTAVLHPGAPILSRTDNRADNKLPVVIVAAGERRMAFAVDEFVAEQEILIKSLGARLRHVPLAAGATLLPSGHVALVLNAANLVRTALGQAPAPHTIAQSIPAVSARKRLLVAEDSVTTRALEKSILEAAGYEVTTAVDGQAAWQILQEREFDLVVSDVEMPHMDGFELTEAVRASNKLHEVPIVLVTARESEQDKARGIAVGADAYLVKSAFDQRNLLETIAQLL